MAKTLFSKVWDDELAMMAQTHAQQCEFRRASNVAVSKFFTEKYLLKKCLDEISFITCRSFSMGQADGILQFRKN